MKNNLILALIFILPTNTASFAAQRSDVAQAKNLYLQGAWDAIVKNFPDSPQCSPEIEYYRGMALAKLGRLGAARQAFIEGLRKDPRNEEFPLELAGVAFQQKDLREAKRRLRQALRLNPGDAYAREFLATIFFLDQNLDAALENWNRIGKPEIRNVTANPPVHLDPELLSRTFAFSPAATLTLSELRTTEARLNQLGVFSQYRFTLLPASISSGPVRGADSSDFDLQFSAAERNRLTRNKWQGWLPLLRGLPYATIYPEFFNLGRSAANFTSLIRWDDQKRRLAAAFSAPLERDPKWRYRIFFDGRNENWDMARTFHGAGPPLTDLNMRRGEAGAEIESVENGRWSWSAGAAIERRIFRNFPSPASAAEPEFADSTSLEYRLGSNYLLMDRPQERFTLNSSIASQLGRVFGRSPGTYERLEAMLQGVWFPRAQGDDYRISETAHFGAARGDIPFDELFMLGLERDNDLPLRAHIGTFDGRKGNAPLGRRYFLSNWEVDKNIYSNGWAGVAFAPFLDTGRITDNTHLFGEPGWLWDTGGEVKVRVLGGVKVVLTYGKDLQTGRNTFYTSVER